MTELPPERPGADAPDAPGPLAPGAISPDAPDAIPPAPAMFSLEGRAVPALYLIGWVGSVLGVSLGIVATLAGGANPGAPWMFLLALVIAAVGFLAAGGSQAIERGRRPELPYRGPSPLLAFGAVITLTLIALIVILAPLAAAGLDPGSPVAVAISLVLTTLAYAGVVRLLVVGTGALSWRHMGLVAPAGRAVRELLLGAAWGLPILVVTGFLGIALQGLLGPTAAPPNPLPPTVDPLGIAFNLLSAAVLAPIGEELFFRGFATTAWNRMLGARPAILRGALFFSAAHIATQLDTSALDGATHALYAFLLRLPVGIALGWMFLRRGSLWAPIGLHAVFNGLQVFALASMGAPGA